jgi:SAM-dependent methyltransferase
MYDNTTPFLEPSLLAASALQDELERLVDLAWEPGWAPLAMAQVIQLCATLQQDAEQWVQAREVLLNHRVGRLMQEDPLVHYACKPKAVWLDLLLDHTAAAPLLVGTSRAGLDLFAVTKTLPWASALRNRTAFLARMVDAVAADISGATILTLGAGHLREAGAVANLQRIANWTVLETDPARRQALYESRPRSLALRTLRCSLRGFAQRPFRRGCFDLICLPELPADWSREALEKLVRSAFMVLKPGGRLVLCAPGRAAPEAAWMEVFLGQSPAWGTVRDMQSVLSAVEPDACALRQAFPSIDGHMIYGILRRQG